MALADDLGNLRFMPADCIVPPEDAYRTNDQACLSVYAYLHTIDPNIVGFEVISLNEGTEEWEVKLLYPNGAEGHLLGRGLQAYSITDAGHFDLEPFDKFKERMSRDEIFMDDRLEPRE